jgi:hypothetical protein
LIVLHPPDTLIDGTRIIERGAAVATRGRMLCR